MKIITLLLAVSASLASMALSASMLKPLLSPAELSTIIDKVNPQILDIRGKTYSKGHIPGAVSGPYSLFRGPQENPGQLLDVDTLKERFEALGLDKQRVIVIVPEGRSDSDFGAAARVYWTLKSTGFTDLSILNGGMSAWQKAGFAINKQVIVPHATELDIQFSDKWTAETDHIIAVTQGKMDALLLDARPIAFFEGRKSHPQALKPGTLPGAQNHVYSSFFEDGSAAMSPILNANELKNTLGILEGEPVVSFCNTGHWAAINWFALSEIAGIDNVKLYPGSMVEYSNAGLEMENTPGLMKNFINRISEH